MVTKDRLELAVRRSFQDARQMGMPFLKKIEFRIETKSLIQDLTTDELDYYARKGEGILKIMSNTLNAHHPAYVDRIKQFREVVCERQAAEFGYDLV